MKKIDEKFKATSSLFLPAIDDELCSDIATGGANIFQMDGDSQQEHSENECQYNTYVNKGKFCNIPQHLKFPKYILIEGWYVWCIGQPSYVYTNARWGKVRLPIHLFALFWSKNLPKGFDSK